MMLSPMGKYVQHMNMSFNTVDKRKYHILLVQLWFYAGKMVKIIKVTHLDFHKDGFEFSFRWPKKKNIQFQHQKGKQLPHQHDPIRENHPKTVSKWKKKIVNQREDYGKVRTRSSSRNNGTFGYPDSC